MFYVEQKVLRCKEQLIIDAFVTDDTTQNKKPLHTSYIDYVRAFDIMPHLMLIEVLDKTTKVNEQIIRFLKPVNHLWNTNLNLNTNGSVVRRNNIEIKRGIFHYDSI